MALPLRIQLKSRLIFKSGMVFVEWEAQV